MLKKDLIKQLEEFNDYDEVYLEVIPSQPTGISNIEFKRPDGAENYVSLQPNKKLMEECEEGVKVIRRRVIDWV